MAKIEYIHGNIFNTNCQAIVNAVNCKGVMGKGIALTFKNRYRDMYLEYKIKCDLNEIGIGTLFYWKGDDKIIVNFPTKYDRKQPSELRYIERGLQEFIKTYKNYNIKSIAFPKLGTALGGLNRKDVNNLFKKYLEKEEDLYVEIYSYDPNATDNDFELLKSMLEKINKEDIIYHIPLSSKQIDLLYYIITNKKIHSMGELEELNGIGEKGIEKIYNFIKRNKINTQSTQWGDKQESLFSL